MAIGRFKSVLGRLAALADRRRGPKGQDEIGSFKSVKGLLAALKDGRYGIKSSQDGYRYSVYSGSLESVFSISVDSPSDEDPGAAKCTVILKTEVDQEGGNGGLGHEGESRRVCSINPRSDVVRRRSHLPSRPPIPIFRQSVAGPPPVLPGLALDNSLGVTALPLSSLSLEEAEPVVPTPRRQDRLRRSIECRARRRTLKYDWEDLEDARVQFVAKEWTLNEQALVLGIDPNALQSLLADTPARGAADVSGMAKENEGEETGAAAVEEGNLAEMFSWSDSDDEQVEEATDIPVVTVRRSTPARLPGRSSSLSFVTGSRSARVRARAMVEDRSVSAGKGLVEEESAVQAHDLSVVQSEHELEDLLG